MKKILKLKRRSTVIFQIMMMKIMAMMMRMLRIAMRKKIILHFLTSGVN